MEIEIPEDVVILDPGFKHARGYNPHMSLGKRARLQEILDSDDEDYPFDLGIVKTQHIKRVFSYCKNPEYKMGIYLICTPYCKNPECITGIFSDLHMVL